MNDEELLERLEGAYSTIFERSLAREAAKRIRDLNAYVQELEEIMHDIYPVSNTKLS